MKELKEAGIHTGIIRKALEEGKIEKVKRGLYKLVDYPFDENESFAMVCRASKNAVISLLSAASYYDLTTFNPVEIYVAMPMNTSGFSLDYPPLKVFYFKDEKYFTGIENIETNSGKIKIYNCEKTLVDLFRYKNKLGEDVFLESLKNYLSRKNRKINILSEVAQKLGHYKKMEPFIKGAI